MLDAETIDTIDSQRASRSSFMGVVTRTLNRLKAMRDDDSASFDIDNLADRLNSLKTTERRCNRAMDAISDEEVDEEKAGRDEAIRDKFASNVNTARALLKRYIAQKTAHGLASNLRYKLENLEATISRSPDQDHSIAMDKLGSTFATLEKVLRESTIIPYNRLRCSAY